MTSAAISTITCRRTSRPVISRSSHTSRSSASVAALIGRVTRDADGTGVTADVSNLRPMTIADVATRRSSGRASMLRPLDVERLRRVARRPRPQPRLARAVGAAARAGHARSRHRPRRVPGALRRVGAPAPVRHRVRVRHVPARRHARRRGEPRQRAARAVPVGFIGYWIDEQHAGSGYIPEARGARAPLRVRRARPAPRWRRRSCPATRRAGASRRSSGCATRAPRSGSCRSAACGKTTCATRSPARSGPSAATSSRRFLTEPASPGPPLTGAAARLPSGRSRPLPSWSLVSPELISVTATSCSPRRIYARPLAATPGVVGRSDRRARQLVPSRAVSGALPRRRRHPIARRRRCHRRRRPPGRGAVDRRPHRVSRRPGLTYLAFGCCLVLIGRFSDPREAQGFFRHPGCRWRRHGGRLRLHAPRPRLFAEITSGLNDLAHVLRPGGARSRPPSGSDFLYFSFVCSRSSEVRRASGTRDRDEPAGDGAQRIRRRHVGGIEVRRSS